MAIQKLWLCQGRVPFVFKENARNSLAGLGSVWATWKGLLSWSFQTALLLGSHRACRHRHSLQSHILNDNISHMLLLFFFRFVFFIVYKLLESGGLEKVIVYMFVISKSITCLGHWALYWHTNMCLQGLILTTCREKCPSYYINPPRTLCNETASQKVAL